jgi:hypothetical protein
MALARQVFQMGSQPMDEKRGAFSVLRHALCAIILTP